MTCPEATACCPHHAVAPTPLRKRHTLRFQPAEAARWTDACRRLTQLPGVTLATATAQGLEVEYDLLRITLPQIEMTCAAVGLHSKGGLHGWRRGWWAYTESNERQNTLHPPHIACCNRPPDRPH